MAILSSFPHPQVVPNLYEFLSHAEHTHTQKDILNNVGNQTVDGPHWLHCIFGGFIDCLFTDILQISKFGVSERKRKINTCKKNALNCDRTKVTSTSKIARKDSWAPNLHIRIISKGSCDTEEYWCWKIHSFAITRIQ